MPSYRDPAEARAAGVTYHLVPKHVWAMARQAETYQPDAFTADGFIHCTNGLDALIQVANTFYRDEQGEYVVLALDVPSIASDVRYDDPEEIYPHIYGPLNTGAVIDVLDVVRAPDGQFLDIVPAADSRES